MQQLRDLKYEDLLFLDTETVRTQENLILGSPEYEAWDYKMSRSMEDQGMDICENYVEKSALFPEFSKLVCISVGQVLNGKIVVKSYYGIDEETILKNFMRDLDLLLKKRPALRLVGHSLKGFDIPFIFKRSIVNRVPLNRLIDVGGLKPWEVIHLDTKELWKSCGYYNTSLIALCLALGVDSPKSDITGNEVGDVYYKEGESGLKRISEYCERGTVATIQCFQRMRYDDVCTSIEHQEVSEPEPEGVIQRISNTGVITADDKNEILENLKGASYEEKEMAIKMVRAALAINKIEMPEDLELEMLM